MFCFCLCCFVYVCVFLCICRYLHIEALLVVYPSIRSSLIICLSLLIFASLRRSVPQRLGAGTGGVMHIRISPSSLIFDYQFDYTGRYRCHRSLLSGHCLTPISPIGLFLYFINVIHIVVYDLTKIVVCFSLCVLVCVLYLFVYFLVKSMF